MAISQIQTLVSDYSIDPIGAVAQFELSNAERTVYSRSIEMAALDLLRFDQFSKIHNELVNKPGMSITLSYFDDLPEKLWRRDNLGVRSDVNNEPSHNRDRRLREGRPIETDALEMVTERIWVGEYGKGLATTELNSRQAFVNWIDLSLPTLARDYAKTVDRELRNYIFGCRADGSGVNIATAHELLVDWDGRPDTWQDPYVVGTSGTRLSTICVGDFVLGYDKATSTFPASIAAMTDVHKFTTEVIAAATEKLAVRNISQLPGGHYGCIVSPHQLANLKTDPMFREAVIHGSRNAYDIYNGYVGTYDGVVFFESATTPVISDVAYKVDNGFGGGLTTAYGAVFFGADAWCKANALPVELRTDGIHDFGREIKIAYYGMWGQKVLRPFNKDRAVLCWTA